MSNRIYFAKAAQQSMIQTPVKTVLLSLQTQPILKQPQNPPLPTNRSDVCPGTEKSVRPQQRPTAKVYCSQMCTWPARQQSTLPLLRLQQLPSAGTAKEL